MGQAISHDVKPPTEVRLCTYRMSVWLSTCQPPDRSGAGPSAEVEEAATKYLSCHEDGFTAADLRNAYPHLNDRQLRALLTMKDTKQEGQYAKWTKYSDRFDDLSEEAGIMDERVMQYFYNGLKHTSRLSFKFDPYKEESLYVAYYRLKTAAAYNDCWARLMILEPTVREEPPRWKETKCHACGHVEYSRVEPATVVSDEAKAKASRLRDKCEYWYDEHRIASYAMGIESSIVGTWMT